MDFRTRAPKTAPFWAGTLTGSALISLVKGEAFRQAVQILAWQAAGQVLLFFGSSWMMRCLGPRNLGISALVISTANLTALAINLGLSLKGAQSLATTTDTRARKEIIELITGIRLRIGILLSLFWLLLSAALSFGGAPHAGVWALGAFLVIVNAPNPQWIMQGIGKLPLYNKTLAIGSAVTACSYLLFFRPGTGPGADIIVNVFATSVVLAISWRFIRLSQGVRAWAPLCAVKAWESIKAARYAFGGTISLYFATQFDVVLISGLANLAETGIYRAANSLIAPIVMLTAITDSVLFPRLATLYAQQSSTFHRACMKLTFIFAVGGTIVAGLYALVLPILAEFLLGTEFASSVAPSRLLIVSRLFLFVGCVTKWGLMAVKMDRMFFWITFTSAVSCVPLNLLLTPTYGAAGAALSRILCEIAVFATMLTVFIRRRTR